MTCASDSVTARHDNSEFQTQTVMMQAPSDDAAASSRDAASFDSVAVWVNEGGAGGEVIR